MAPILAILENLTLACFLLTQASLHGSCNFGIVSSSLVRFGMTVWLSFQRGIALFLSDVLYTIKLYTVI